MLSELDSDQRDPSRCGHCGEPLSGRFGACPMCDARPAATLGQRPPHGSTVRVPLPEFEPDESAERRLPARRIWKPTSNALTNPYAVLEEPATVVPVRERLRQPLALSASALLVASAVYLGFIHSNEEGPDKPIGVAGKVQTQNGKTQTLAKAAQRSTVVAAVPKIASSSSASTRPSAPAKGPVIASTAGTAGRTVATATAAAVGSAVVSTAAAAATSIATASPRAPAPAMQRLASASPRDVPNRTRVAQTGSPSDKARPDISRHLRAARADLQQNNLSATRIRLAAAMSVQPDNRDALNIRATLNTREQQRDALLSLARGCGYIARWQCVSHNANTALSIDSSSKEAQRLVMLATRETQMASVAPPAVEPPSEPVADIRELITHH